MRERLGVVAAMLVVLGAFGVAACQPLPAETALRLSLTDTASAGVPAANVTVSVFPADDFSAPAVADGITDPGGNVWFTHDELPAGDYVVRFGSPVFVIDGSSVPGSDNARWYNGAASDAAMDRSGAATVTVSNTSPVDVVESYAVPRGHLDDYVLKSDGSSRAGATVTVYAWPSRKPVASMTTGAAGYYHFDDLPAQNYKLEIGQPGWATIDTGYEGSTSSGEIAYSLEDGRQIPAVLDAYGDPNWTRVLQPEATITGTVKPDGTNPTGGVWVIAVVASTNHAASYTTTAADGTFTLDGLAGVGYRLAFLAPDTAYAPMMLGGGTGPGPGFDVADGSAFSLQPGGTLSVGTATLTVGADCATAQAIPNGDPVDLSGADLHNCDLSDSDLTNVDLYDSDLAGANLSNATLPDYGLANSPSLGVANLSNANLSNAQSPSSGFSNVGSADLSGADLSHADMHSTFFTGSDLTGANLSATNLSNGAIDETDLSGTDLSSATFSDTDTYELIWTTPPRIPAGYELIGTNLVGAGVLLARVDLSGADLSGMNLANLHLSQVDLTGANLTNTTLTDITWNVVDLSGADLSGATLTVGYSAHLTSDANTVSPTGWEIVNGSFQQTPP